MKNRRLIGQGREAKVYDWGENTVIKLFNHGTPFDAIHREFRLSSEIHTSGLPVPKVIRLEEIENQTGIVFEKIGGSSLLSHVKRNPLKVRWASHLMAEFHLKVHQHDEVGFLSPLLKKLSEEISKSSLDQHIKEEAYHRVKDGESICHLDFHLDNILFDGKRIHIIDWPNALIGDPAADIAKTIILHKIGSLPTGKFKKITEIPIRNLITHYYMKRYIKISSNSPENISRWLLPIAIARLNQNIPGESDALINLIFSSYNGKKKHG
jgi:aminoglycoside phosphotransferase (APT) family kinase protein